MSTTRDPSGGARPLELCWLDARRVPRIRRRPPWRRILDEAAPDPKDAPGDPSLPQKDVPPDDRRDVLLVLARADAVDADGVSMALASAVRDDGKFAPPLVLVAGELRLSFGEIETLKATVTTATPFIPGDEPLKAAVDGAKEFLALPDLAPAPAIVEALTARIRDAFGRTKRAVPASYLDSQTERALLEQRRYQKRTFQGAPHLRALLQGPTDRGPMLVYLPEAAADKLPLYPRFGARLVAEAHVSVDQYETHAFALEALALAREVPPAARKG